MTDADATVDVIIPALNEERSIGRVLDAIPPLVRRVIVVDNGSTDRTAAVAADHGAIVVSDPRRGYGRACLTGLAAARGETVSDTVSGPAAHPPDILAFMDADFADDPAQLPDLIAPIAAGRADLVIGSRARGEVERGALTVVQRFGNALACALMRIFWPHRFTDLGPFRAIRTEALPRLRMDDAGFGWTVQMQARALRFGLRHVEVPVRYRRRIGVSKISGTVRGVVQAGGKILFTVFREAAADILQRRRGTPRLIVFTRLPQPGRSKTRLIPALGEAGAARVQLEMTRHVLRRAAGFRPEVRYTGGSAEQMRQAFGNRANYRPQGDGDLGVKLGRAIGDAFAEGAGRVVVIGADCPGVDEPRLAEAFAALRHNDLVLGPATDGGYYLIGLRRPCGALFDRIDWGSDAVFEQTRRRARHAGLTLATLPPLPDVDRPDDLLVWHRHHGGLVTP